MPETISCEVTLQQYLPKVLPASLPDAATAQLVLAIANGGKSLSEIVARGQLSRSLGETSFCNVHGERQKTLDVLANDLFIEAALATNTVAGVASEELEHPAVAPESSPNHHRPLLLTLDPLDGSSNIDTNVTIGTIFSILPALNSGETIAAHHFLQAGNRQLAAGYIAYGPATLLVLTVGKGVAVFTLEASTGEWRQTNSSLQIPKETNEFAINLSNWRHWQPGIRRYIEELLAGETGPRKKNFNMRWVASMVADVHRILVRGGIFLYPWDQRMSKSTGKLRLLYEANPMAFLVEQAGGMASNGQQSILNLLPSTLHERVPVILGAAEEVQHLNQLLLQQPSAHHTAVPSFG